MPPATAKHATRHRAVSKPKVSFTLTLPTGRNVNRLVAPRVLIRGAFLAFWHFLPGEVGKGIGSPASARTPDHGYHGFAPRRRRTSRRRSGIHLVLKSNQKPVIASQMIPKATVTMSGWLKLVRFT